MRPLNDDPITCEEDDILDRSRFVTGLASILKGGSTAKSGRVILLDGDWGEGKTSVFNLLRKKIADDVDIVEFNVWGAAINESSVTEELLLLMASHCGMNITSFSVKNYAYRSVNTNSLFIILSTILGTGILTSYIRLDMVSTALMTEMGVLYLLILVIVVCLGWEYIVKVILTICQSFEHIFLNSSSSVSFKIKMAKKFLKLPRPLVVLIDDLDRLPATDLVRFLRRLSRIWIFQM